MVHILLDERLDRALVSRDDLATRELLATVCAPGVFDRARLLAAVAAFPVPRSGAEAAWSAGQAFLSGTWGRRTSLEGSERRYEVLGGAGLGWRDGRSFRVELGPGVAVASSFEATRRERAVDRVRKASAASADVLAGGLLGYHRSYDPRPVAGAFGVVTSWSARSRSRMVKAFASVDFAEISRCYCGRLLGPGHNPGCDLGDRGQGMPLAMVTLTYPGDWVAVAASGAAAKRHLSMFRLRWLRAMGWPLQGAWKEEFQRPRPYGGSVGEPAPHFHLLCPVPAMVGAERFAWWLARTWADVVDASGWAVPCGPWLVDARSSEWVRHLLGGTAVDFSDTARMSDPKRCGIYFLKHSTKSVDSKEYQHTVPAAWAEPGKGPGRFWGFWGLKPATIALDLDFGDFITVRRCLRKVAGARAREVKYQRAYYAARSSGRGPAESARLGVASAAGRKLRTLGAGGQLSGGWVVCNDGPALAESLARAVVLRRDYERGWLNRS